MDPVNVRNLEEIRESQVRETSWNLPTLVLAALGGAGVLGAGAIAWQSRDADEVPARDPLDALIEESRALPAKGAAPSPRVAPSETTFARVLSDDKTPTAAFVSVSGAGAIQERAPASAPALSSLERLPVVPLPVGDVLHATSVTQRPTDPLAKAAVKVSTPAGKKAAPGQMGGYQLQVAASDSKSDAKRLASELRKRGHRAHVIQAVVKGKLWHRVRLGPFADRAEALKYLAAFRETERMQPFVVAPGAD